MALEHTIQYDISTIDIKGSLAAGIIMGALQPDTVILAGILLMARHQALCFDVEWKMLLKEVAQSLPRTVADNLLAVERGRVLEQLND